MNWTKQKQKKQKQGKAVARGGGVPRVHVHPPFQKKQNKKNTISFVE